MGRKRLLLLSAFILLSLAMVGAHGGDAPGYMDDCFQNGTCHGMSHMMGYGMFGMGGFGFAFGILFWVLVIAGAFYLLQRVLEQDARAG